MDLRRCQKVFFYFKNVVIRGQTFKDGTVKLVEYLASRALDFCNEEYAQIDELTGTAINYDTVKKAFSFCFELPQSPKKMIKRTVSNSLDSSAFSSSLRKMDSFFKVARFGCNAKLGLLWKAVMEHTNLFQFATCTGTCLTTLISNQMFSFLFQLKWPFMLDLAAAHLPRKRLVSPFT